MYVPVASIDLSPLAKLMLFGHLGQCLEWSERVCHMCRSHTACISIRQAGRLTDWTDFEMDIQLQAGMNCLILYYC